VTIKAKPANPLVVSLAAAGQTTLVLDPGATAALGSLHITPSPIAPATAAPGGLAFSVTGGSLNTETFAGQITHSGGLRLTQGATVVDLTSFNIEIDDAPDLTALLGGNRASILDLDLSQAQPSINGKSITVSGVKASLTAAAATALNGAFHTHAFTPGLMIGTATVQATAK
ncbi:MAG: HtaA domain-containing protein, partial [Actinomycetota bacterium]|nr:HtaA domain-containing protein [Actinomycetota bacterium]